MIETNKTRWKRLVPPLKQGFIRAAYLCLATPSNGLDKICNDSLTVDADSPEELIKGINEEYYGVTDFAGTYPALIFDHSGLRIDLYRQLFPDYSESEKLFSDGRETMAEFWEREKEHII